MDNLIHVKKATPGTVCSREMRLDPAGKPVYCNSDAAMVINGRPLCRRHAKEQMAAIEARLAAEPQ